jgi:hypothetical protein
MEHGGNSVDPREAAVSIPTLNERVGTPAGGPALEARVSLHVAIVCAIDGARFAAIALSEPECMARVAAYVAEQASEQLWPPSAGRIHELFAAGDLTGAIGEYFRCSGERWDAEWLVTTSLRADLRSPAWSGTIPVPQPIAATPLPRSSGRGSVAVAQGVREG